MATLIKILIFIVFAYFVLVGMVATYFITLGKHEERKRQDKP
jgi:flagellar basal body-associated protein FliL